MSKSLALIAAVCIALAAPAARALPDYTPDANAPRSAVPDAYQWDLTPLYASPAAWAADADALHEDIAQFDAYRGRLADPAAMRDALHLYFSLHNRASYVTQYANLALDSELTNEQLQANSQRGLTVMDELMAASGFLRAEILGLDDATIQRAYATKNGPAEYRSYIDNLRRRTSRVLGPEAEKVLQMAGDNLWAEIDLNEIPSPLEDAFGAILSDITWPMVHDEDGQEVQLTLASLGKFRASTNRAVRAEAMDAFFATLRQFQHAFAATLSGQFKLDVTYARARGYDTALEAYLDKDNLDPAMFHTLIAAVNANLTPLHRYVELRRQVLKLDDVHIYDLYLPLVDGAEMDVTYKEAMEILPKALAPLGKDYVSRLRHGLDPSHGWIDVYPSDDKDSGAFSASVYGAHPYIKMNYLDSLDDLSTLAHEFGHALHSELAMENQTYQDFRYVPFLAEIASTCNEALLSDYLAGQAESKAQKAGILAAELETIRTTIYRQTLFSEFERAVHGFVESGTPITATLLDKTYGDLIRTYYGPSFTVSENDGMEWAYIPHFYYKYYVYTYATGLSSGLAIAERVKTMGQPAADAYLGMLKGGCSDAPITLLQGAGVDLTEPTAIKSALARFDRIVTELADILGVDVP